MVKETTPFTKPNKPAIQICENAIGKMSMPVLHFDGTDDFLEFDEINQLRTLFIVLNRNPGNRGFVLGHHSAHPLFAGEKALCGQTFGLIYMS